MINKLGHAVQINIMPIDNKYKSGDYIPSRKNYNSNKSYTCKSIMEYKLDRLFKEYSILLGFKIQVPFGYVARLYPVKNLIEKYRVMPSVSVVEYYPEDSDNILAFPVICTYFKDKDKLCTIIPNKAPIAELVIDVEPPKTILNVINNYEIPPYFSED